MSKPFDAGDRTYYVSDERLKAFRELTPEQRFKWVEELAHFVRLARACEPNQMPSDENKATHY